MCNGANALTRHNVGHRSQTSIEFCLLTSPEECMLLLLRGSNSFLELKSCVRPEHEVCASR